MNFRYRRLIFLIAFVVVFGFVNYKIYQYVYDRIGDPGAGLGNSDLVQIVSGQKGRLEVAEDLARKVSLRPATLVRQPSIAAEFFDPIPQARQPSENLPPSSLPFPEDLEIPAKAMVSKAIKNIVDDMPLEIIADIPIKRKSFVVEEDLPLRRNLRVTHQDRDPEFISKNWDSDSDDNEAIAGIGEKINKAFVAEQVQLREGAKTVPEFSNENLSEDRFEPGQKLIKDVQLHNVQSDLFYFLR